MKRIRFLIWTLFFVATVFLSNGFAQNYVHHATLTGHTYLVNSVSFSLDGETLASGSSDNTIRLWDVHTGQALRTLTGHTLSVYSVSFSPEGETLASGSADATIRLWDVRTGQTLQILPTLGWPVGEVYSVIFNPFGNKLASGGFDPVATTLLWSVWTGQTLRTLTGHTDSVTSVSFSPKGEALASGSADGTIRLWAVGNGESLHTLTGHTGFVRSVSFSPDGQTLASGSRDRTVRLWSVSTGQSLRTLTGHTDSVTSVSFSPDRQTLASGSWDKTIRLWRIAGSSPTNVTSPTPPKTSADQVYDNAIRAVMWIVNPGISEGSGVLIDKQFRLVVTNAHVTGGQNTIDVYFPAPDEKGELIKDRHFYLTSSGVLKRLGYYTKGHVVAKNEKTDLAIIQLDGLPETAREIDWNLTPPPTNTGDLVYILGNPGGQELWRWTLGEFLNDHGSFLHIQSDVFGGNSGGPVLNRQGVLLGIVARSDRHMNASAIPVRDINRLLSESRLKHSRSRR